LFPHGRSFCCKKNLNKMIICQLLAIIQLIVMHCHYKLYCFFRSQDDENFKVYLSYTRLALLTFSDYANSLKSSRKSFGILTQTINATFVSCQSKFQEDF
jgi:hypothetical protein